MGPKQSFDFQTITAPTECNSNPVGSFERSFHLAVKSYPTALERHRCLHSVDAATWLSNHPAVWPALLLSCTGSALLRMCNRFPLERDNISISPLFPSSYSNRFWSSVPDSVTARSSLLLRVLFYLCSKSSFFGSFASDRPLGS